MLRLKVERINWPQSQERVAIATGIPQPIISLIENGRREPTPAQLARLAAVFGVKPDDLLKDVVLFGPPR